jgi:hypothetical protein
VAVSDKSSAACDSTGACNAGPLASARSAATASTIGLVAGGALAAAGVALVLFAPKHEAPAASVRSVTLGPLMGAREEGLSLGGSW